MSAARVSAVGVVVAGAAVAAGVVVSAGAVVPPGHAGARHALHAPVGERVWFAGEALSRLQWGTAGGAFAEGARAAGAAAERIRAGTG